MPNVVRVGDMTTGHSCFPPQNIITGNLTVLGNNLPISHIGDSATPHACGLAVHPSIIATGSKTVLVGGLPMARVGDLANCGSLLATGSPNITCDDNVQTYTFPRLNASYSSEATQAVVLEAGSSAPYDDEESISLKPMDSASDIGNPRDNPISDDKAVSNTSGMNSIKNGRENLNILITEMNKAGILDHKEQAMFLAQLDHESAGFMKLTELKYTPDNVWRIRGETLSSFGITLAFLRTESNTKGLDSMYEYMYLDKYRKAGFKLGNTSDGDGIKFKGRGFIQLTGKNQYISSGKSLSIDFISNPDLAATPQVAAKIAIDFWFKNGCRNPAKQGNVEAVTRIINGGTNGLEDRKKKYANYLYDANLGRFELPLKEIPDPKQNVVIESSTIKDSLSTDPSSKLSAHFTLADLSTKTLFPHKVKAQHGLSEKDVVFNLRTLANNVLEPLLKQYPGLRVNSAFRSFTGSKSQHERGMACDIQWPGISNSEYLNRAKWIRDNMVYDQLLFEHGNSIWIHLSFDPNKATQRKDVKTMYKDKFTAGLTLYYN